MTAMKLHRYPSPSGGVALGKIGAGVSLAKRLPYDAEVEYLESTGTQYIDTEIDAADDVGVKMLVLSAEKPPSSAQMLFGVFGADNRYGLGIGSYFFVWWNTANNLSTGYSIISPQMLELNFRNSRRYVYGDYGSGDLTETYNAINTEIRLFAAKRADTGANALPPATMKIGAVQISKGDTLVRDFIPVRFTNEQGVSEGAMYDRANPTVGMDPDGSARTDGLYRNRGTGAFTIGPDL